jgi:Ner family transcriptional regulator
MERDFTKDELEAMGIEPIDDRVTEGGWSKEDIKREFRMSGFSLSGFERKAGLPKGSVNQALISRRPKTDKLIAAFFGVHVSDIWPDRYFSTGVSIPSNVQVNDIQRINASLGSRPIVDLQAVFDRGVSLPPGVKIPE